MRCRFAGLDAAAVGADVDLHQHAQGHSCFGGGGVQIGNVAGIVGAYADRHVTRQGCQTPQLGGADDLVGNQHIRHAATYQDLGFSDLLAANADGPVPDLL